MLEKSFGLMFFLKQPKNKEEDNRFVYLKITVDGKAVELSTKRRCEKSKWNVHAGRALGTKESTRELNQYLDSFERQVFQVKRCLNDSERTVTAMAIKDILTGNIEKPKMIMEVFQQHNDQMKALEGIDFAAGTVERYHVSLEHTRSFIKWMYKADDKPIKELDHEFISQYAFWLKTVRKCNHNTTMKYLANFKKVVLICVKNRWLPGDPFANFKLTKKPVEKAALTESELIRIIERKFISERLDIVRDVFVFSCYTGLAYADVRNLKRSDIRKGLDNKDWIFVKRQKTNSPSNLPLLAQARQIISSYSKHPKCADSGLALPVLTNQKMNAYLKEIADLCGINMELTFHIARHTFATTVTLNNGVPIESVSKMLGHASIKQTQHYAKTQDYKISKDMLQLAKSLNKKNRLEV
ncbi:site-specific integrase [Mucilaginibacter ginsenosidivorax]|uniref:Site-specific integrase n=1 Tax=Mucilaginibacter ginsenosidivorax TaxID=862126 RepID=A0A5B8VT15_9SPHI|nr:site-specific integrase [Mucilaginibacter ginsenosidivorax]QEC74579.1 site-specific integrase [Mucilaginibacter ginsenosidivorax]